MYHNVGAPASSRLTRNAVIWCGQSLWNWIKTYLCCIWQSFRSIMKSLILFRDARISPIESVALSVALEPMPSSIMQFNSFSLYILNAWLWGSDSQKIKDDFAITFWRPGRDLSFAIFFVCWYPIIVSVIYQGMSDLYYRIHVQRTLQVLWRVCTLSQLSWTQLFGIFKAVSVQKKCVCPACTKIFLSHLEIPTQRATSLVIPHLISYSGIPLRIPIVRIAYLWTDIAHIWT